MMAVCSLVSGYSGFAASLASRFPLVSGLAAPGFPVELHRGGCCLVPPRFRFLLALLRLSSLTYTLAYRVGQRRRADELGLHRSDSQTIFPRRIHQPPLRLIDS